MEDEFDEIWMYSNKKASKEAYKDLHHLSNVYKLPDTKQMAFLKMIAERLRTTSNLQKSHQSLATPTTRRSKEDPHQSGTTPITRRSKEDPHQSGTTPTTRRSKEEPRSESLQSPRKHSDGTVRPSLTSSPPPSVSPDKVQSVDKEEHETNGGDSAESTITTRSRTTSPTQRYQIAKEKDREATQRHHWLQIMPSLDEFDPLDAIDLSVDMLRFDDEAIHTVYEQIKREKISKGMRHESIILKPHYFKTHVEQLKHDKFNERYYGVEEFESDEDISEKENKSDNSLSTDSDDEHPGPNHNTYIKYNIPSYPKALFQSEKTFNQNLKIKREKTFKAMFDVREDVLCNEYKKQMEDKRISLKNKVKKVQNKTRQRIIEEHDKKYKYQYEHSKCQRVQEMDDIIRAELLLEKLLQDQMALSQKHESFEDMKKVKKLEGIFKYETDLHKETIKPVPPDYLEEMMNKLEQLVFDEEFIDQLNEENSKRERGLRFEDKVSSESDPEIETKDKTPTQGFKLIVNRDFTNISPKTIKKLENLGILYEESLYDVPDHALYQLKPPKTEPKESSAKLVSIIKKNSKKKRPSRKEQALLKKKGLKFHKDSLRRRAKKKKKEVALSMSPSEEAEDEYEDEYDRRATGKFSEVKSPDSTLPASSFSADSGPCPVDKKEARTELPPGYFSIEFDPVQSGTITEGMIKFSSNYNVPVSDLSRLVEGTLVLEYPEHEDRKEGGTAFKSKKSIRRRTVDPRDRMKTMQKIKSERKSNEFRFLSRSKNDKNAKEKPKTTQAKNSTRRSFEMERGVKSADKSSMSDNKTSLTNSIDLEDKIKSLQFKDSSLKVP